MMDYKHMLLTRAKKAKEAAPENPDKPLTVIQLQNRENVRKWRDRLRQHRATS